MATSEEELTNCVICTERFTDPQVLPCDHVFYKNTSLTLKQASMKQWTKQSEKKLPSVPQGLRVISQQLWCCCGDAGIVIFDSELQQQRTIPADDDELDVVLDVAEMSNGDVVIAASNGLYAADVLGKRIEGAGGACMALFCIVSNGS